MGVSLKSKAKPGLVLVVLRKWDVMSCYKKIFWYKMLCMDCQGICFDNWDLCCKIVLNWCQAAAAFNSDPGRHAGAQTTVLPSDPGSQLPAHARVQQPYPHSLGFVQGECKSKRVSLINRFPSTLFIITDIYLENWPIVESIYRKSRGYLEQIVNSKFSIGNEFWLLSEHK